MKRFLPMLACLLWAACGDDGQGSPVDAATSVDAPPAVDAATSVDADVERPTNLSETGLYGDFAGKVIADGVLEYVPEHLLWSDGVVKRRWVWLPAGATIDTSNMDYWVLPVGTKLWKGFALEDGTLLETRMLSKLADDQWYMVSYAWNAEGTDAVALPGGQANVLGTQHDIPAVNDCRKCHDRMPGVALGFSAIQLDHAGQGLTLDDLVQAGRLSDPPSGGPPGPPYFDIPGDATEVAALGYLHANCGGCHHPQSSVLDTVPLVLRLEVGSLSRVTDTTIYTNTVDIDSVLTPVEVGVIKLVDPGSPATSVIHARMNRRDLKQMPPLGTEVVDADGLAAVDAWISSL